MALCRLNQKIKAYKYLKEKLLDCEILPGQYINEKDLIHDSECGRTPIREALMMLESDNLIEIIPRKGTRSKMITAENVNNLFSLRKLLEPSIAVQYRKNLDLRVLLDLDSRLHDICLRSEKEFDKKELYAQDISFHRFIAEGSLNPYITRSIEPLLQETYRIGIFNSLSNTENSPKDTYEQHHKIIYAIMSENDIAIREAFLFHLNYGLVASLAAIKK